MKQQAPYRDPSLPVDERVEDLLGRLSLEEKAGQITQYFYLRSMRPEIDGVDPAEVPEEYKELLEQPEMVEAEIRAGRAGSALFVRNPEVINTLQRIAVEESPHGIPLIFGYDVIHGLRTIMPVPIAMAAAWDPQVPESAQGAAAAEARAVGISWAFAPMVDIARDPRWGRIIEGAGEDPCLGAAAAAAQVRGFQGGDEIGHDGHVIAGPKHFAGYGAARGGRDYEDSEISDSELWNVYLPPFRAAVQAGAGNIMSAYMDLNGVPASGSKWLLTDVLRGELGFEGFVVSDANAVQSLAVQHFAKDLTDAGVRAVNAGLDMEMGMLDSAYKRLPQAVEAGAVSVETIDTAVRNVLRAKFRMGLFEQPYADVEASVRTLAEPAHREVSRRAAERSLVLLKNEALQGTGRPLLPLGDQRSIAVIGQLASSQRDVLGPWVFDYDLSEVSTVLDGVRERAGEGVRVDYAVGEWSPARRFPSMFDDNEPTENLPVRPQDFDDEAAIAQAVETARRAEVAIVVVGQPQNYIGEKASTSTLELPGRQAELLRRVAETGTPTVALVMSGRPLDLRWAQENLPSIMQVWYPGTRGGQAVASALFGDVDPAGRLPFTWPRTVGQVPMVYSHYRTFQPEGAGERYWDEASTPLFVFGHGGSYASFEYSQPRLSESSIAVGESLTVSVDVTNVSERDGEEVVQLYVHQLHGESTRPVRELKGFQRVRVPAGETVSVDLELGPDQLRYWSAVRRDFHQDSGTTIEVYVGGSSLAAATASFEVR